MGCGSSEEESEAPRAERQRRTTQQTTTTISSTPAPIKEISATATPFQATPSRPLIASPPQSASKDIGKSYKGTQLGTEAHQSKSYTERKHLEEIAFKKALKQPVNKPKEPSVKEMEQEIITNARGAMFDLSLLTDQADDDELEDLRSRYEEALSGVSVETIASDSSPRTTLRRGEVSYNPLVAASHSSLFSALASMKVPRMNEVLVEPYKELL